MPIPQLPQPEDGLVASIAEVANLLGVDPASLTDAQQQVIYGKILLAQGQVEAAIGRPVLPELMTRTRVAPEGDPDGPRAWDGAGFDDTYRVVSYDGPDPDGYYEVTALVGVDGRDENLIRGYVREAAAASVTANPNVPLGGRVVSSVSAGGQSVSYASSAPAAGSAGGAVTLDQLARRYKRRLFATYGTSTTNPITGNTEFGARYVR